MKLLHWLWKIGDIGLDIVCRYIVLMLVWTEVINVFYTSRYPFARLASMVVLDKSVCMNVFIIQQFVYYYVLAIGIFILKDIWRLKSFKRPFMVGMWNFWLALLAVEPFLDFYCPVFVKMEGYIRPRTGALVVAVLWGIWCLVGLYQLQKYPVFSKTRILVHGLIFLTLFLLWILLGV